MGLIFVLRQDRKRPHSEEGNAGWAFSFLTAGQVEQLQLSKGSMSGGGHQHRSETPWVAFYTMSLTSRQESPSCHALLICGLFFNGPKGGMRDF